MVDMLKSTGAMAGATLASRVLGMVREICYARFMGDGLVAGAEVVEVAQHGQQHGADGLGLDVEQVDDLGEGHDLPEHESQRADAHASSLKHLAAVEVIQSVHCK